jgi:hypothetical protein
LVAGFILADIPYDVPALAWVMLKIGHLLRDGPNLLDHKRSWH